MPVILAYIVPGTNPYRSSVIWHIIDIIHKITVVDLYGSIGSIDVQGASIVSIITFKTTMKYLNDFIIGIVDKYTTTVSQVEVKIDCLVLVKVATADVNISRTSEINCTASICLVQTEYAVVDIDSLSCRGNPDCSSSLVSLITLKYASVNANNPPVSI